MRFIRLMNLIMGISMFASCVYQKPDMTTDMSVHSPKFNLKASPTVLFDAGHSNFHSIHTTYTPFATLLKNDGIEIREHRGIFREASLKEVDLLIIANALPPRENISPSASAFSQTEIEVLADWVYSGGSLLLIADHDPFGSAAADLGETFGAGLESVWTVDTERINKDIAKTTWLEFSSENGGLGEHPILLQDSSTRRVEKVITFTGQSFSYDSTWTPVLKLSKHARNYYLRGDATSLSPDSTTYRSVPGQSQLMAREYGQGKIVLAGEAAMFTAQEVRIFFKTMKAGFNYDGYDNKNLVLNIIHWLLA